MIIHSKRELAEASHLKREPISPGLTQAYTNICVKSYNLLPGEKRPMFFLKKKRLSRKTNISNEWWWERITPRESLSEDRVDGGGPKGDGNQEDDPFKVVLSWKLPPVHSVCAFCSKCCFCLNCRVCTGQSSSLFPLREDKDKGYYRSITFVQRKLRSHERLNVTPIDRNL